MKKQPKEIEVKFRVEDLDGFRSRLKKLGAELVWQGTEKNYYLDTPDQKLHRAGQVLRVREWSGHSNSFTFKEDVAGQDDKKYKVRTKLQIEVSDAPVLLEILKKLGQKPFLEYKKERAHYKLGKNHIELDRLGRDHFVEIEGAKFEIDRLVGLLGLDWSAREKRSYVELVKAKNKK